MDEITSTRAALATMRAVGSPASIVATYERHLQKLLAEAEPQPAPKPKTKHKALADGFAAMTAAALQAGASESPRGDYTMLEPAPDYQQRRTEPPPGFRLSAGFSLVWGIEIHDICRCGGAVIEHWHSQSCVSCAGAAGRVKA